MPQPFNGPVPIIGQRKPKMHDAHATVVMSCECGHGPMVLTTIASKVCPGCAHLLFLQTITFTQVGPGHVQMDAQVQRVRPEPLPPPGEPVGELMKN